MKHKTVAEELVRYLERRGVRHVFGLCGHTNIAVLSAMAESRLNFVNVRHEQIAAHAADGYARVTGKTAVVLTHLGPGLTNAATGVANAALDCIPLVVIAGDIPSHYYGKHPHQEVNLHADGSQYEIYRPFVKRAWRVERADLFPEIIEKAFQLAESGQPGPVLVDVPMDVFSAAVDPTLFDRLDAGAHPLRASRAQRRHGAPNRANADGSQRARDLCGRGRRAGQGGGFAAPVRGPHGDSGRAQPDGERRAARRSPAVARDEWFLGHDPRQSGLPQGRLGHGVGNSVQGSGLQLLVSRLHVQRSRLRGSST